MKNYVYSGERLTLTAPVGGVTSGAPKVVDGLFVVPEASAAEGETFTGLAKGVCKINKAAVAIAVGKRLYWDAPNAVLTTLPKGRLVAVCTKAAVEGDAQVEALLFDGSAIEKSPNIAIGVFDATGGKAIGTHDLVGDSIPVGAYVRKVDVLVKTTFTSAGDDATIALGVKTEAPSAFVAAVAIDDAGNPWDAGWHAGAQDGAADNIAGPLTAERAMVATVAVEALTAGKLAVFAEYMVSPI
jgi:predicted RecA/RadA family phage recombinase